MYHFPRRWVNRSVASINYHAVCLSVCSHSKRKVAWAVNTKLGMHWFCRSNSQRSPHHRVTCCLAAWVCSSSIQLLKLGTQYPYIIRAIYTGSVLQALLFVATALTLLVGRQEAYGPADATATHCVVCIASVKSRLVLPFWYRLTRVVPDKWLLNGCARARVCVCVCTLVCFIVS